MSEQVTKGFLGSKVFRFVLLALLAVILVTSNMLGRARMTLAVEQEAARSAQAQQELVEER